MNFQDYLQSSAEEINQEITQTLKEWEESVKAVSPKLLSFCQAFNEVSEGGKRLRGALVRLGYELAGGGYNQEILKPTAAIEIFQTSILAHDDVIDSADLRRGRPTLYKVLGGDHRAISQTICLGDIGFFLANQLIADSDFEEKRKNKALSVFSQMVINTGLGEMLDVELPYLKDQRKEEDVWTIHRLKTAFYTIVYPLTIGAVLGGATQKLISDVASFGERLGIAFQLQDDILGVFGDEKVLGKSVTSDIEEGKNTLLIIEALKNADERQKEVLGNLYGKGKISLDQLEEIKRIFEETGALKYSKDKATELVKMAKKVVDGMEVTPEQKSLLKEMADFIVERQK